MKDSLENDENTNYLYISHDCGQAIGESNVYGKECFIMKKTALVAIGLGVAYLMRNEDSRNKMMNQLDSFAGGSSSK